MEEWPLSVGVSETPLSLSPLNDNGHPSTTPPIALFGFEMVYQSRFSTRISLSLPLAYVVSYLIHYSTLNMEVISSSETTGSVRTTGCYNPEDRTLLSHCRENRRSNNLKPSARLGNYMRIKREEGDASEISSVHLIASHFRFNLHVHLTSKVQYISVLMPQVYGNVHNCIQIPLPRH